MNWKKHFINRYYLIGAIFIIISIPLYIVKWFYPEYYIKGTWNAGVILGALFMVWGYRHNKINDPKSGR